MNREELLTEIATLKTQTLKQGDLEIIHEELDMLLLKYIGDSEITKAFKDVDKWYA